MLSNSYKTQLATDKSHLASSGSRDKPKTKLSYILKKKKKKFKQTKENRSKKFAADTYNVN